MTSPDFTSFFVASAGAGAALVGLLFVAVSVNPGRNAGPAAPPERQAVAASAFTALINAFFFSMAALIASAGLGGAAIVLGAVSIIGTMRLIGDLLEGHLSRRSYARRVGFIALCLLVYGLQVFYGLQSLRYPRDVSWAYSMVYPLLAIYAMGLTRAWQLLGARRRGLFSWFSPLNDLDEAGSVASAAPDTERQQ
jgi:hypothetical protein